MKHLMKLKSWAFIAIKNGTKTIEIRLYDEKRKLINVDSSIMEQFYSKEEQSKYGVVGIEIKLIGD